MRENQTLPPKQMVLEFSCVMVKSSPLIAGGVCTSVPEKHRPARRNGSWPERGTQPASRIWAEQIIIDSASAARSREIINYARKVSEADSYAGLSFPLGLSCSPSRSAHQFIQRIKNCQILPIIHFMHICTCERTHMYKPYLRL